VIDGRAKEAYRPTNPTPLSLSRRLRKPTRAAFHLSSSSCFLHHAIICPCPSYLDPSALNHFVLLQGSLISLSAAKKTTPDRYRRRPTKSTTRPTMAPNNRAAWRNVHFYDESNGTILAGVYQGGSLTDANLVWILSNVLLVGVVEGRWTIKHRESGRIITETTNSAMLGDYDISNEGKSLHT
jgi:hypothetical protein